VEGLRKVPLEKLSNGSYRICGKHFEESQFADPFKKKLMPNAIPTLFDVPNPPEKVTPHRPPPKRRLSMPMMPDAKRRKGELHHQNTISY
jgi:hypothetical protein